MSADLAARHLVCAKCHGAITQREASVVCAASTCAWRGAWTAGIFVTVEEAAQSFFDDKVAAMQAGLEDDGITRLFQDTQMRLFAEALRAGSTVLDVVCWQPPYQRGAGTTP